MAKPVKALGACPHVYRCFRCIQKRRKGFLPSEAETCSAIMSLQPDPPVTQGPGCP